MMRLPAALKWLMIGVAAWGCWRIPIIAHQLAGLSQHRMDVAESAKLGAPTPLPVEARATSPMLERVRKTLPFRPNTKRRKKNVIELALPAPLPPPLRPRMEQHGPPAAQPPVDPAGWNLAERGYARLRAGDRKDAASLLAQAIAAAPGDPRSAQWRADRAVLTRRWSGDAYVLARHGGNPGFLGATPTLGGSQLGARLAYNFNPLSDQRITLAGRVYQPVGKRSGGTDAAQSILALELQPARKLPLTLAVDRYIALGDSARDAWSLRASGGVENIPVTARISASAYAQTGVIGVHSRDAYVDGWAKLHAPITDSGGDIRLRAGATVWAAAQPGASRIDIGPSIDVGGNIGRAGLRGSLDYRIRVSGNAAPGNGPAFTLQAGF